MERLNDPFRNALPYFAGVALVWLVLSLGLCFWVASDPVERNRALAWTLGLSTLAWADLFSLGKTVAIALSLIVDAESGTSNQHAGESRARGLFAVRAIKASTWGALKLACLLLFGVILYKGSQGSSRGHLGHDAIPTVGLMTGVGTLFVVPLIGGLIWNLKNSKSSDSQK